MHNDKIRALYLQPAPLFGGAERQAATLVTLLPQYGVDVVAMAGPGIAIARWLEERGASRYVHSPHFPGGWPKQRGLLRLTLPYRYLRCGLAARAQIQALIDAHRIDVVLGSLPFAWFTATPLAHRRGLPVVWRTGGGEVNAFQKVALWLATRFVHPDLLLCTAEAVKRNFAPLVPAPVEVVPSGVDQSVFHPRAGVRARFRPREARVVIGYAARLAPPKRPRDFIALAARLKSSHPDVQMLLAGEGSRRPEYEAMARALGADNLTFLGFVADMPSFYAACDILVLPSRAEGCPNFALEAMAMRKVVVASDVPGTAEVIRHGREGLLYPCGNIDALCAAVELLLGNPSLYQRLAAAALARVSEHFSANASAARVAAMLRRLVAGASAQPSPPPTQRRPQPQRPSRL